MRTSGRAVLALAPAAVLALVALAAARSAAAPAPAPYVISWTDASGFAPASATPSPGQALSWFNTNSDPLVVSRTAAPTFAVTIAGGASSSPLVLPSAAPGPLAYQGDTQSLLGGSHHQGVVVVPARPAATTAAPAPTSTAPAPTASRRTPASPRPSIGALRQVASRVPSAFAGPSDSPSPSAGASGSPLGALVPIPLGSAPPISEQAPEVAAPPLLEQPTPSPSSEVLAALGTATPGLAGERVAGRRLGLPVSVGVVLLLGVGSAITRVVRGARENP